MNRPAPWRETYPPSWRQAPEPDPCTTLDRLARAVTAFPDTVALVLGGVTIDYRELERLTDAFAAHLQSVGFAPGDRLALSMQNTPEFVIGVYGAWKAGGVVVPVNPMYRDELSHIFADAGVAVVACESSTFSDALRRSAEHAGVRQIIVASATPLQPSPTGPDIVRFDEVVAGASRPAAASRTPEDAALLSYTSGTSGRSKGAVNSHRNVTANAATLRLTGGFLDGAVILTLAPLFHITGMVCELLTSVDLAGTLVLTGRFEPGRVLDLLEDHQVQYTVGPSTAYLAMLDHPNMRREAFAHIRLLNAGGAALPPALVARFAEETGHYLRNGYGLTETSAPAAATPLGLEAPIDEASGTIAVGLPLPWMDVEIHDEDGRRLPPGEVGEIAIAGAGVVPQYWNNPDATRDLLVGGRLNTGDVGFIDVDGWLYVIDRKKDMINAAGFKVWPREVEDVLQAHQAVLEAAVVGEPDPYRGETVVAYVSPRRGMTVAVDDLVSWCRDHLAAYKAPRTVHVLDSLPKTESGKILRRVLRDRPASTDSHSPDKEQ